MRTELVRLATAYLMGWVTVRDCAEWLASVDWDDPSFDPESQATTGRLELLVTEVLEGIRPEAELWTEAAEFVTRETNSVYSQYTFMANSVACSSGDLTSVVGFSLEPEVGASQSWSISPPLVSA